MPNNNPQQTTPQQQIARAAESANRAAERLESGAENAANAAIEKVRQVREEAQSGLEHQREQIALRIRRVGGVLRSSSQALGADDPLSQQLFNSAGERVEQVAHYINNLTPGELASDVQSLARRRPGLFFGGSFILGLALGRFAKSSSSSGGSSSELDRYDDTLELRQTTPSRGPRRNAGTRKQGPASNVSSAGAQAASTQGASSHVPGTTGAGSAHTPASNAAPSYGNVPAAAPKPAASEAPSSAAREVQPGEGSKS